MNHHKGKFQPIWLLVLVVFIGFGARILVATRGNNYDFNSWIIVADIVDRGGNVYANTKRYNYGPIWFRTLHVLDQLASKNDDVFRYSVTAFLSIVDVGIFTILWALLGKATAVFFLLNPISIIISGYHNQFDNYAILLGLLSVLLIRDDYEKSFGWKKYLGLFLMGISLMIKHILFAFPVWLAVKQKGFQQKLAVVGIPYAIFILGFLPYLSEGKEGIIQNVFLYQSWNQFNILYRLYTPLILQMLISDQILWLTILLVFAFIYRQKNTLESLLLYTGVLIVSSPAIANQYLAIVVPFASAHPNPFMLTYTFIGTWHLLVDNNGLNLNLLPENISMNLAAFYVFLNLMLVLGIIWVTWRNQIKALIKTIALEFKIQLGHDMDGD